MRCATSRTIPGHFIKSMAGTRFGVEIINLYATRWAVAHPLDFHVCETERAQCFVSLSGRMR